MKNLLAKMFATIALACAAQLSAQEKILPPPNMNNIVPEAAMAYGPKGGDPVPVDLQHPLPTLCMTYSGATLVYCPTNGSSGGAGTGGTSIVTSRISYNATATGTGYSAGDQLDRIVTTSPGSSTVNAYWVNVSAGGLVTSAPAANTITLKPETLTNTGFTALQGGAANTASNPFFFQATAGNAVIGKVGFDQSTPGTSNGVTINDRTGAALGTPTNPFGFNLTQVGGNAVATGTGTANAGTPRVVLSSDSPAPLVFGSQTDPACTTSDATACSAIALWKEMVGQYAKILQAYTTAGTTATTGLGVQGMTGGVPLVVSGQVADGSAPANPALHIAGVDATGFKRTVRTDTNGILQIGGTVTQADSYQPGTIAAANANAAAPVTIANGYGTGGATFTGLTASAAVLIPEGSFDGTNYVTVPVFQAGTKVGLTAITADGQYRFNASGRRSFRFRVGTVGSGTINQSVTLSVAGFDPPAANLDTNGDLRVPTVTVTPFYVSIAASTSTELLAPLATRVGFELQCAATADIGVSTTHAALTSAVPASGGADLVIKSGNTSVYIPTYVSGLGVTAYTGTAQGCWGKSYARQ